eukprot:gnl/Hemi2/7696_TR2651_c0_g1_i1.p1 gnl/Hemi2/7696_TR2651_c0_g1~~gnl/Hemi2/7696_TR2651_c0_g1_i1.p1  ORF type:complete len:1080 (-),score=411.10 gnl/Hemi2/7696_TR2651_c0_g1_i1:189-3428(-)
MAASPSGWHQQVGQASPDVVRDRLIASSHGNDGDGPDIPYMDPLMPLQSPDSGLPPSAYAPLFAGDESVVRQQSMMDEPHNNSSSSTANNSSTFNLPPLTTANPSNSRPSSGRPVMSHNASATSLMSGQRSASSIPTLSRATSNRGPANKQQQRGNLPDVFYDSDDDDEKVMLPNATPTRQANLAQINELKKKISNYQIYGQLDHFMNDVKDQAIVVGNLSVEMAEKQEALLEEERISTALLEAEMHRKRQEMLIERETRARRAVQVHYEEIEKKQHELTAQKVERDRMRERQVQRAFRLAEDALHYNIKQTSGQLQTRMTADRATWKKTDMKRRVYKIEYEATPQPAEVRLHMLRAVKDKCMEGRYVVLVSMCEHLGGEPLHWLGEKVNRREERWKGATHPFRHKGRFFDIEMRIHQTIHMSCPSPLAMVPSMLFLFELFHLKGKNNKLLDKCVAWGAFPMFDMDCHVVRGTFKLPLLDGEVRRDIVSYAQYEALYASNLDYWHSNLYFSVDHTSKYLDGQREYAVELQFAQSKFASGLSSGTEDVIEEEDEEEKIKQAEEALTVEQEEAKVLANAAAQMETELALGVNAAKRLKLKQDHQSRVKQSEALGSFTYNLPQPKTRKATVLQKLTVMRKEITGHMGVNRSFRKWDKWHIFGVFIMIWVAYYCRMMAHYFGQWVFLFSQSVPINSFTINVLWVSLDWNPTTQGLGVLFGFVLMGPIWCMILMTAFTIIVFIFQVFMHRFNDTLALFVIIYGLEMLIDPLIVLCTDVLFTQNWTLGEWFILYNNFAVNDNTGVPGIFVIILFEVCILLVSLTLLYIYVMRVHRSGRLADLFFRLNGNTGAFFVPFDLEISAVDIRDICSKATRWRGENGARRKISVCDFLLSDKETNKFGVCFEELITHLGIYSMAMDGTRDMYRHFMRLSDGTFFEVFGDLDIMTQAEFQTLRNTLLHSDDASRRQIEEFLREGLRFPGDQGDTGDGNDDDDRRSDAYSGMDSDSGDSASEGGESGGSEEGSDSDDYTDSEDEEEGGSRPRTADSTKDLLNGALERLQKHTAANKAREKELHSMGGGGAFVH